MHKLLHLFLLLFLFTQCKNAIKNEHATVVQEPGTEVTTTHTNAKQEVAASISEKDLYGFWVGNFENAGNNDKTIAVSDYSEWSRENKINISIDSIDGERLIGHSVVAGNYRPFSGTIKNENDIFYVDVKEPGDKQYDGRFSFTIKDTLLQGTWQAFKKIDISKRKYTLTKKIFKYNPNAQVEDSAVWFSDWEKASKVKKDPRDEYKDYHIYYSITGEAYSFNASNKLLEKKDVENLVQADLYIIRNAIYARHGYSFKNRPLRVFFDKQSWYIPVYADIRNNFTEIEKKNIQLLLRYEKNAKEYYDDFGR